MNPIRIFVSAPGDVAEERALTKSAVGRLRVEFAGRAEIELLYWEDMPLTAISNFQRQIPAASDADIVVTILWSRLGTPLASDRLRADGTRYESGTVFEFEEAMASAKVVGKPKVLFYQRLSPVVVSLDAPDIAERQKSRKELDQYVARWFGPDEQGALNRAFRTFYEPDEFAATVEEHLRRQIEQLLPDSPGAVHAAAVWNGSPFRGLQPFEFEHSIIYCGRENATGQVVHALKAQAAQGRGFVVVVGMSGSGKSSLVRAGVMRKLDDEEKDAGRSLRRAIFRPGEMPAHLVKGVAEALCAGDALSELREGEAPHETFAEYAVRSPAAAADQLHKLLRAKNSRLVLLIDQLEEIFSLQEISAEQREKFLAFIEHIADKGPVWVVATLRNDFCAQAFENPVIARLKFGQGQIDLQPPTPTEIGRMIRTPARVAGLRFEESEGRRLDDLIHDEAVGNARALPLLEFTLEQLYADGHAEGVLKFETFRAFKGLRGSIANKAESTFRQLDADAQRSLGRVLASLCMVDPDNSSRVARRRLSKSSFANDAHALAVIDAFVDARLFTSEGGQQDEIAVEVAHEALLSEWDRAKDWVKGNEEFIKVRNRVSAAAEIWARERRDDDRLAFEGKPLNDVRAVQERALQHEVQLDAVEQEFVAASVKKFSRRVRVRRIALASFATLACVATAFAISAFVAQGRAESERKTAHASINFLTGMFDKMEPRFAMGQEVTVRQVLDVSNLTVRSELAGDNNREVLARVLRAVGQVYSATGDRDEAILVLTDVLERHKLMGSRGEELAAAHLALGDAFYLSRLDLEAKTEYQAALAELDDTGRDDSELLADVLLGLADTEYEDFDASVRYGTEGLAIYARLFGPKDSRAVRARLRMANSAINSGQAQDTVPLLEGLLAEMSATTTPNGPDVAEVQDTLGVAYWESKDSAKASENFVAALGTFKKVYRADDPDVANTLHSLARVELEQCALQSAELNLLETLRIQSISMKLPRPLGALANYNMGLLKLHQKDVMAAERHFDASLKIVENNVAETSQKLSRRLKVEKLTDEQLEGATDDKIILAKASALIGKAEVQIEQNHFDDAGSSLDDAESNLEILDPEKQGWRFGLLNTTRGWLLAKRPKENAEVRAKEIDDARANLTDSLARFTARWPAGSLFAEIAIKRLRALEAPVPEGAIGCPTTPFAVSATTAANKATP